MRMIKKGGQIWVETVIYTLIGLAIIGLVLAVANPKINAIKDKVVIDQSTVSLDTIYSTINDLSEIPGNQRIIELTINKGVLFFDLDKEKIYWEIPITFKYSEENTPISKGQFIITTEKKDPWKVRIEKDYHDYNIDLQFEDKNSGLKELTPASIPYELTIENRGKNALGNTTIVIRAN
jgi:hypothetical protein